MDSIKSLWTLEGKTYVVTGGSKGIGYAVAQSLLVHKASSVIICSRGDDCDLAANNLRTEIIEKNSIQAQVYSISCDISTKDGRQKLTNHAREKFGNKLDGLINNVGMNIRKPIEEQSDEEYEQMMRTNVDSAYFLCKDLQDMLLNAANENGGAAVVNVASAAGVQSSGTGCVYGMSKAAMIHFSKILACEWAKFNIRVNAVAPWMTMTPMLEEAVKQNPAQLDKVKSWTPMHRLASSQEIAGPITYLMMPSSSYITGQCLGIDGGLSAQAFDGPCITPQT